MEPAKKLRRKNWTRQYGVRSKDWSLNQVLKLSQEAGVEPPVIYSRFKNIDELIEQYARKYDYWLNNIISLKEENTPKENLKKILVDLINELYNNEIMQRVLIWEMNDTHKITRRMAHSREIDSADLIEYYNRDLGDVNGMMSLMISGIYYLILHRKISTFSTINYNTPQGRQILIETVENMVDKLLPDNSPADTTKKLLERGADKNIIKRIDSAD